MRFHCLCGRRGGGLAAVAERGQNGAGLRGEFTAAVVRQCAEALLHVHGVQLHLHHTWSRQGWDEEARERERSVKRIATSSGKKKR